MTALEQLGRRAKQAEQFLRTASTASKDHGLTQIADALLAVSYTHLTLPTTPYV